RKETGEDLLALRQAKLVGPQLQCTPGATRQIAQIVRTQPQDGKRDIERIYLKAVNNATQFIYIENQYFRWPPLAEAIKKAALEQTGNGRDPGLHGALHLFVVTNATTDGVGAGTLNTQRMLESLGRAETIPEVTKLLLIKQAQKMHRRVHNPTRVTRRGRGSWRNGRPIAIRKQKKPWTARWSCNRFPASKSTSARWSHPIHRRVNPGCRCTSIPS
ncbi:hypothetical protein BOH73_23410, partial [Pseudomonas versuta]